MVSTTLRSICLYRFFQKILRDFEPVHFPGKTFQAGEQSNVVGSNAKTRGTGKGKMPEL
jgi:hypothetical protein